MGKITDEMRNIIARNIRQCRMNKYPGRGGGKKCAEAFGVSPQQWSPWERGMRTPDELRLSQIAEFFDVTVDFLRRDGGVGKAEHIAEFEAPAGGPDSGSSRCVPPHAAYPTGGGGDAVYVPVFVLLPHLPENLNALYNQFNAVLNSGKK